MPGSGWRQGKNSFHYFFPNLQISGSANSGRLNGSFGESRALPALGTGSVDPPTSPKLGDFGSGFDPVPGHPSQIPAGIPFPGQRLQLLAVPKSKGEHAELLAVPSWAGNCLLPAGSGHLWVLLVLPRAGSCLGWAYPGKKLGVNDLLLFFITSTSCSQALTSSSLSAAAKHFSLLIPLFFN